MENVGSVNDRLRTSLNEVYKYSHIHTLFVDQIVDELNDIKHVKHSWYYRDDLPKINFFDNPNLIFAASNATLFVTKLIPLRGDS